MLNFIVWAEVILGVATLEILALRHTTYCEVDLIGNRLVENRLFLNSINTACSTVFIFKGELYCFAVGISAITEDGAEGVGVLETVIFGLVFFEDTFAEESGVAILVEYGVGVTRDGDEIVGAVAVVGVDTIFTDVALLVHCHLAINIECIGAPRLTVADGVGYRVGILLDGWSKCGIITIVVGILNAIGCEDLGVEYYRTINFLEDKKFLARVGTNNVEVAIARIKVTCKGYRVGVLAERPTWVALVDAECGVVWTDDHVVLPGIGVTAELGSILSDNEILAMVVAIGVVVCRVGVVWDLDSKLVDFCVVLENLYRGRDARDKIIGIDIVPSFTRNTGTSRGCGEICDIAFTEDISCLVGSDGATGLFGLRLNLEPRFRRPIRSDLEEWSR